MKQTPPTTAPYAIEKYGYEPQPLQKLGS